MFNQKTLVTVSLMTLVFYLQTPEFASAPVRLTTMPNSLQSTIEPTLVEQKSSSGEVLARLQITPGASSGEFQFEVEDFRRSARATGTGKILEAEVLVRLVESGSRTYVGLQAKPGWITLSLDRLSFNFIFDEKAQTLLSELERRAASGVDDTELLNLTRQIDEALKITTEYKFFIALVRNSAAFDMLTAVRSLIDSVPREEVARHRALASLWYASRFFTVDFPPSSPHTIRSNFASPGQLVKVTFETRGIGLAAQQGSNCNQCSTISCCLKCFNVALRDCVQSTHEVLTLICAAVSAAETIICIVA